MLHRARRGFGVIEVLILGVIIFIIGGLAWFALGHKKSANSTSPAPTASSSPSSSPKSVGTFYLSIPEMKIKLKVPASLDGIYYVYTPDSQSSGYAKLSTKALKDLDPQCSAETSSTATVGSTKDPDAGQSGVGGLGTLRQSYPDGIMIDGVYFYIAYSNGPCAGEGAAQNLQLQVREDMQSLVIEKL